MTAADTLSIAWGNLTRRKGRAALTTAGVLVGVTALVLMISLGLGIERELLKLFETEDALRTISVARVKAGEKQPGLGFDPLAFLGQISPVTDADLESMGRLPGVEAALPVLNVLLRATVEAGARSQTREPVEVAPVHPNEERRYAGLLVEGRMWQAGERACLLPSAWAEGVKEGTVEFGAPLGGESLPEEKVIFKVAGVLDSKRLGMRGGQIFMPLDHALELRRATKGGLLPLPFKEGTYLKAEVRVTDPRRADEVAARLRNMGYQAVSPADVLKVIGVLFLILEGFLASVGAIGLVVSLFGIANTMAMAVLERVREIGIMKALGARNGEIGRIFLSEAAMIGALGGVGGLALGTLVGALLNAAARAFLRLPEGVSLFHVSPWLAAGSVLFSISVSLLAGYLPARRAARMEPVAALRYE